MNQKVIFEKSKEHRNSTYIPNRNDLWDNISQHIPQELLRDDLMLPSLGELEVVRHYTNLAKINFSVDTHSYPLGSCTMKYNPKINECMASLQGFTDIHPYQDERALQGILELMWHLEQLLCAITGMQRFTFQPSSGAQGELSGMLMIHNYHKMKGLSKRKVIIPDSAHGTNPATAAMCGYETVVAKSTAQGLIDIEQLYKVVDDDVAAIMLTNPNTLGLFEENILEVSNIVHKKKGLLYYDGANFNPLLGITTPSLMGFDVIHLNLHKTFSTPHGCGGPGAGAVGVNDKLWEFLPVPVVDKKDDMFCLNYNLAHSIGKVRSFYGNVSVLVRAYAYLLRLGAGGMARVAKNAVINANYIRARLKDYYELSSSKRCMHEVVFSAAKQKERGAGALDIAKRLIDYGIHPPTMYFPLIVKEALMVEPTETESKETIDCFIDAMTTIDKEIDGALDKVTNSPHTCPVARVDEVKAARLPNLRHEIKRQNTYNEQTLAVDRGRKK